MIKCILGMKNVYALIASVMLPLGANNFRNKTKIAILIATVLCFVLLFYSISDDTYIPEEIVDMTVVAKVEREILLTKIKEEGGTGCDIPNLDAFHEDMVALTFRSDNGVDADETVHCAKDMPDWVECNVSKCFITKQVQESHEEIRCYFRDIHFDTDQSFKLGDEVKYFRPPVTVYRLKESDYIKIECSSNKANWTGMKAGFRPTVHKPAPLGRDDTFNVMIIGIDSVSKNQFIREMRESYKALDTLGAVILNGYNIVGDGTPAALFPILTGKSEVELPETRKKYTMNTIDTTNFLFHHFREDGYRTLFFEDMPQVGTFQRRFNGFQVPPADHYLLPLVRAMREHEGAGRWACLGQEPGYVAMLNLTRQFFNLDGKKFSFTFIVHLNHEENSHLAFADKDFAEFMYNLKKDGVFNDTLFILMGDHGRRYAKLRNTIQGKLEERLPLMAIILPERLKKLRPAAEETLRRNVDVLTTPFDIHSTILDVADMNYLRNNLTLPGNKLARSMSLLEPIPATRSCGEAAVLPHWCTCMKWRKVAKADRKYHEAGFALLEFINKYTDEERYQCAERTMSSIEWVLRQEHNPAMLNFKHALDADGFLPKYEKDSSRAQQDELYQVRIVTEPGFGVYEATMLFQRRILKFSVSEREISRTTMYGAEPYCIGDTKPHLAKYCYCLSLLKINSAT